MSKNYPLISDLIQIIKNNYLLLINDGLASSGLFIIDKEGIIQYYTVNNLLCDKSIIKLCRILKSIQYIKEHPGYICQVEWKSRYQILYSHPLKLKVYFNALSSNK